MSENIMHTPVDRFYESRENFIIVGLTGLAGSGCSTLAGIMEDSDFIAKVRTPDSLPFACKNDEGDCPKIQDREQLNNKLTRQLVFKRKYSICYNYIKQHYTGYTVIKYSHVVLLYTLIYAVENNLATSASTLKNLIGKLLEDKFYPSREEKNDVEYKAKMKYGSDSIDVSDVLKKIDCDALWTSISVFSDKRYIASLTDQSSNKQDCEFLAKYFFEDNTFRRFIKEFMDDLSRKDYYCFCFMFHRLASCIRNWGDPLKNATDNYKTIDHTYNHLYDIIKLINYIIKGEQRKKAGEKNPRRIVIDSIRNSMEGLFLKERYTAFYLIAVHDAENRKSHLNDKVRAHASEDEDEDLKSLRHRSLLELMDAESDNEDFEKRGRISSPNIGQCIADAEIHMNNAQGDSTEETIFYSLAEQWLKYATLIQHPGLITPSAEERCMIVAYSAKFNSGCLSRQVGACITNHNHAIRTIGWNDVPYGQIPCSLRELNGIVDLNYCHREYLYSAFERGEQSVYANKREDFVKKVREKYVDIPKMEQQLNGLPLSYCFKSLHNDFEHQKNQVHTRSLHAEENAMMQMVKYGGEPLMNGIIYVTASPCELCSKKLYQIGVRKIVYIDPYPGISRKQITECGFKRPELKLFQGAYGSTYYKLYQPFMSYKDEISLRTKTEEDEIKENGIQYKTNEDIVKYLCAEKEITFKSEYTESEYQEIISKLEGKACGVKKILDRFISKITPKQN